MNRCAARTLWTASVVAQSRDSFWWHPTAGSPSQVRASVGEHQSTADGSKLPPAPQQHFLIEQNIQGVFCALKHEQIGSRPHSLSNTKGLQVHSWSYPVTAHKTHWINPLIFSWDLSSFTSHRSSQASLKQRPSFFLLRSSLEYVIMTRAPILLWWKANNCSRCWSNQFLPQ